MKKIHIHIPNHQQEELNGRLLLFFDKQKKERLFEEVGIDSCPFFGKTYYGLHANQTIVIDPLADGEDGYPIAISQLPKGKYYVQAFFVKYTRYQRKDGHILWGMEDHGGGGNVALNPYNLYSEVSVYSTQKDIHLSLSHEIALPYTLQEGQVTQQGNYENSQRVRYFKIKSECLSDFWQHDMYLGMNILLPRNYTPNKKYPTLYWHGHWPAGNAPMGYGKEGNEAFTRYWEEKAPEMLVVSIRNANMFYDDSYLMNSENLGPWADAFVKELIPAFEKEFSAIAEPWARANAGGSTGGWESMALQIFYPDFFGGSWPMCPDAMNFHAFQIIDLYKDKNAYTLDRGWYQTERPACRDTKGNILWTVRQENRYELALGGDKAHGLGQWGIWEAVYGPKGQDGYPVPIWDAKTGKINKKVVAHWKKHFDLHYYLRQHKEVYPSLRGKIHLRGGDMDNYYLNLSQYLIEDFLAKKKILAYSKTFPRKGHSGHISYEDLLEEIYHYMEEKKS